MDRKILAAILTASLLCAFSGPAAAGILGYSFRDADKGFWEQPSPVPQSSGVVAADALIGRPLGLATTIAGSAVFIVTLPMSLGSGSTGDAAWGLVGQPGGWTFVRPMGRSEARFEDRRGVFSP
jgi:hypothetical protein